MIVRTLPTRLSHWLRVDLFGRLARVHRPHPEHPSSARRSLQGPHPVPEPPPGGPPVGCPLESHDPQRADAWRPAASAVDTPWATRLSYAFGYPTATAIGYEMRYARSRVPGIAHPIATPAPSPPLNPFPRPSSYTVRVDQLAITTRTAMVAPTIRFCHKATVAAGPAPVLRARLANQAPSQLGNATTAA
jgi:hypothetical protein